MTKRTMSTLTLGSITYEIVDKVARGNSGSTSSIPEFTAEDAGKFLKVNSNGELEWQSVANAEGVSF